MVQSGAAVEVDSLVICNQTTNTVTIRVSIAVGGAADDPKQYLYYDLPIDANNTFIAALCISLSRGDIVRVQANSSGVSFNLFGKIYQ